MQGELKCNPQRMSQLPLLLIQGLMQVAVHQFGGKHEVGRFEASRYHLPTLCLDTASNCEMTNQLTYSHDVSMMKVGSYLYLLTQQEHVSEEAISHPCYGELTTLRKVLHSLEFSGLEPFSDREGRESTQMATGSSRQCPL